MLAFFQELTETAKVLPRCTLIATLPSSAPYGEEGERALNQLQQIFGRVEAIYTPVEGEEVDELIRRRLLEDAGDPTEARRTADGYVGFYQRLGVVLASDAAETAAPRERAREHQDLHAGAEGERDPAADRRPGAGGAGGVTLGEKRRREAPGVQARLSGA